MKLAICGIYNEAQPTLTLFPIQYFSAGLLLLTIAAIDHQKQCYFNCSNVFILDFLEKEIIGMYPLKYL